MDPGGSSLVHHNDDDTLNSDDQNDFPEHYIAGEDDDEEHDKQVEERMDREIQDEIDNGLFNDLEDDEDEDEDREGGRLHDGFDFDVAGDEEYKSIPKLGSWPVFSKGQTSTPKTEVLKKVRFTDLNPCVDQPLFGEGDMQQKGWSGPKENGHVNGNGDKPWEPVHGGTNGLQQGPQEQEDEALQHPLHNNWMAEEDKQRTYSISHSDGDGHQDSLTQWRVLYMARGREIERLKREMDEAREVANREGNILKTQLMMAKGEHEKLSHGLQQLRKSMEEKESLISTLEGKVGALEAQVDAERKAKEEAVRKLRAAEITIDALKQQVDSLAQSESISRAREQHEAAMAALRQRHQQEVMHLKETEDSLRHQLISAKESLAEVEDKLRRQTSQYEQAQLERAETVNQLTRSLEQSQQRCQEMLECGTIQEVGYLKAEVNMLSRERDALKQQLSDVNEEMRSLRSEVQVMENVSRIGGGDSAAKWSIHNSEELVSTLKMELEQSLMNVKHRRNQVSTLQAEVESLQRELAVARDAARKAEVKASESHSFRDLEREILQLKSDRIEMEMKIKELSQQNRDACEREHQLAEQNAQLKQDMAKMVEDKRDALEKCKEACAQAKEEAVGEVRKEMEGVAQRERDKVKEAYEAQVVALRTQNQKLATSLDEVKNLYIRVCEERNALDAKLKELAELKSKEEEVVEKIREEMKTQQFCDLLQEARDMWQKETEAKFVKLMEAQVRRTTEECRQKSLEEVARATRATKMECKAIIEAQMQKEMTELATRLNKGKQQGGGTELELLSGVYEAVVDAMDRLRKEADEKQRSLQEELGKRFDEQKVKKLEEEVEVLKEEKSHWLEEKAKLVVEGTEAKNEMRHAREEADKLKEKLMKFYKLTKRLEKDKEQAEAMQKSLEERHQQEIRTLRAEHERLVQQTIRKYSEQRKGDDTKAEQLEKYQLAIKQLQNIYITSLNDIQAQLSEHLTGVSKRASAMMVKTLREYSQHKDRQTKHHRTANSHSDPALNRIPHDLAERDPVIPSTVLTNHKDGYHANDVHKPSYDLDVLSDMNTEYCSPPDYHEGVDRLLKAKQDLLLWPRRNSATPTSSYDPPWIPPERLPPSPEHR